MLSLSSRCPRKHDGSQGQAEWGGAFSGSHCSVGRKLRQWFGATESPTQWTGKPILSGTTDGGLTLFRMVACSDFDIRGSRSSILNPFVFYENGVRLTLAERIDEDSAEPLKTF